MIGPLRLLGIAALAVVLAGSTASAASFRGVHPLPRNGGFDYQLGGGYRPAEGVRIVARDSTTHPARGAYSICYVNGFQTQPGQRSHWPGRLLLRDRRGHRVDDPGWPDETLLDTSTRAKRRAIARHLAHRVRHCAKAGFEAVELDNLDSWTRSRHLLTRRDNLALARRLVGLAHARGLAAAQKNTGQLGRAGPHRIGFDFAIAEECVRYHECRAYTRVYGRKGVLDIEYATRLGANARRYCAARHRPTRTIIRDHELTPRGSRHHVFRSCPIR